LCRKDRRTIIAATDGYAREQYTRQHPIHDAHAQRQHEQLLFQHGRKQLEEMQQQANVQAKHSSHGVDSSADDPHQALIDQVRIVCTGLTVQLHNAWKTTILASCDGNQSALMLRNADPLRGGGAANILGQDARDAARQCWCPKRAA
jgi:hypothetical protein